jgi:glycosyltransferase involved in cell wall biosynthesis
MVSFIVIGKNEGWKLTKCLESVFKTIKENKLTSYEIIYVDSNSIDDSIEIAKIFNTIRIFKISGHCNAAIARNIGSNEAKGDVLFFIDGDNEIVPEFLKNVYNENDGLANCFVSGQFENYNYTIDWKFIDSNYYFKNLDKDKKKYFTAGGLFLIKNETWKKVGGMNTTLEVNEDIDLGIRLAKLGYYLIRKADLISIHHTIPYNNLRRRMRSLIKGDEMYRVIVVRNNLFNKFMWRWFFRENYSVIVLLLCALLIGITGIPYFICFYLLVVLARTLMNKKDDKIFNVLAISLPLFILRDLGIILGFVSFYKKKRGIPTYNEINSVSKNNKGSLRSPSPKLSIIIIGRNEGWKLTKCLESVFVSISTNKLSNFEVIYVDSKSTDDSVQRASSFKQIKVIQLTGDYNAAIARNIGAKECTGDVLFFIDGDMEIIPDFLSLIFEEDGGLRFDFVSGQLLNYNYDYSGKFESKEKYFQNASNHRLEFTTGGIFLIKKEIWNKIGGMKNKLRRNQDIDFGIRLAKSGVLLLRRKELLAIHHTFSYQDAKRIWGMLVNDSELYRAVLLRDNIMNVYQWKLFFRENYSIILLIISLVMSLIYDFHYMFLAYLILILGRTIRRHGLSFLSKITIVIYFLSRDISFLFGFFFFWPNTKKQISFTRLNLT